MRRLATIDSDAHVLETPATWSYLKPDETAYSPLVVGYGDSGAQTRSNEGKAVKQAWVVEGRLQPKEVNVGSNTAEEAREMRDIEKRLAHMDELEIDVQVLYPTLFLRPVAQNPKSELALVRSYNRWLAEIWKKGKERLVWAAKPPILTPSAWEDELRFAKDNGACSIFMRGLEAERRLSDPYFFPLYDLAQKLDLSIGVHAGNNSFQVWEVFREEGGFNKSKLMVIGAFHSLIIDGIPEKFPKVRWGFVETSAQWVPYVLNDLELRFKRRGKRLPKDTLKHYNMYVACQVTDDLPYVLQYAGEDNLVVGTDYGHHDTSAEIEALRMIKTDNKISAGAIEKILGPNAQALYGLH
ncbi:MAG TPA: amidohydrolase family protein [Alphaproteobacteria bacterium]|nr:amidohydrolase family protein [Alphaproteobacteria bacterium]